MAQTLIVCMDDQIKYVQLPAGNSLADAMNLVRRTFSLAAEDCFSLVDVSIDQSITSDERLASQFAAADATDFPLTVKVHFYSRSSPEAAEPESAQPEPEIAEPEVAESAFVSSRAHTHLCDHCRAPLGGRTGVIRYQCANCPYYDLCEACEVDSATLHDPTHVFYKHKQNCTVETHEMLPLPSFNDFKAWRELKREAEQNESAAKGTSAAKDTSVYDRLAEAEGQLEALMDHLASLNLLPSALRKVDEDIEDLIYVCLKLEVGISWASVTSAFRDRRDGWLDEVRAATTAQPLVTLVREFVTFLSPHLTNETFLRKIESIAEDPSFEHPKATLCFMVYTIEKYMSAMGAIKDRTDHFHAFLDRIIN